MIVKELIDNALDACEEQGIAPEIAITIDEDSIMVADKGRDPARGRRYGARLLGPGLKPRGVCRSGPGRPGNALKTIVAMPFVLNGEVGRWISLAAACFRRSSCASIGSASSQRPRSSAPTARARSCASGGLPQLVPAGSPMTGGMPSFYKTPPSRAAAARPRLRGPESASHAGSRACSARSTAGRRRTWTGESGRQSSPTCPHWYEPTDLERLIGAYITQDRRTGRERTVREFVSEFRGLSGSAKCKQVLEAADLSRASLTALLIDDGLDSITSGRGACSPPCRSRRSPSPRSSWASSAESTSRAPGGTTHQESFQYKLVRSLRGGMPQVTEVAFGVLGDQTWPREANRWHQLVVELGQPVSHARRTGRARLAIDRSALWTRCSRVLLLHVAHPRVVDRDRGKSSVVAS